MSVTAQRIAARIETVRPLGGGVLEIELRADSAPVAFLPGQYLLIQHPDGSVIPFSMASAPSEWPTITLHYLAQSGSDDAVRMDDILARTDKALTLDLPHGDCGIQPPLTRPLLLLAGGSGIAQVRGILRGVLADARAPVQLYWGGQQQDDLYLTAELNALASAHAHFTWQGISEEPAAGLRTGTVSDAVIADLQQGALDLGEWNVLLAGGPGMVWATAEALLPHGLQQSRSWADAFSYAPRADFWPAT